MKCPLCNTDCEKSSVTNAFSCPIQVSYGAFKWNHYFNAGADEIIRFPPYLIYGFAEKGISQLHYMGQPSHSKFIMEIPYFKIPNEEELRLKIHRLMKESLFMNCLYCHQPLTPHKIQDPPRQFACARHPVLVWFWQNPEDGLIDYVYFEFQINEKYYQFCFVNLHLNKYKAELMYFPVDPDPYGPSSGQKMLTLQNAQSITPENVIDKMKTYLVFS